MMTNNEAHRLMARGLTYQASGDSKKFEQNRQMVAINNFLWRTDQLIALREHMKASKMLQKAIGVASRMEEPPEEIMKELRIRKKLLDEREAIMPLLKFDQPAPLNEPKLVLLSPDTMDFESFRNELECILFVRLGIFHDVLGIAPNIENDERDESSMHYVVYLGDSIVASARVWVQNAEVLILDRLFVIPEYRGRGLASRLFQAVKQEASAKRMKVIIAMRTDPPESESQRIRTKLAEKLLASRLVNPASEETFLPHLGVAGQFGFGVTITLFECTT